MKRAAVCASVLALCATFAFGSAIEIYFSPKGGCTKQIVSLVSHAKKSVWLQGYAFTSQPIADVLIAAQKGGLDVQVILDSDWPNAAPKIEPQLVASGMKVFIDGKHAIAHNKIIVVDVETKTAAVLAGSFNFTNQAELQNAENIVILRNADAVAKYAANFKVHLAHSIPASASPAPAPVTIRKAIPLKRPSGSDR